MWARPPVLDSFNACTGRGSICSTLSRRARLELRITSPGEAISSRTPSGRPPPSTNTIHFVPLPRLVLPTAEPPFWPERSCRPETSLPTAAGLRHRVLPATLAMRRATHPAPPNASTVASRSPETDTCRAKNATPHRSAAPTKCPPGRPGSRPMAGPACPCAASAQATEARSTPTAHRSTTQTASCPCKKFNKRPASSKSPQLEAESIYETRSNHQMGLEESSPM